MLDTEGKRIQAHGAGMIYENGTYYWYGENKEFTTGKDEIWTWGIRFYSSKDLVNWKDEGLVIQPDIEDKGSSCVLERAELWLLSRRKRRYLNGRNPCLK